jgi:hypothetical protein
MEKSAQKVFDTSRHCQRCPLPPFVVKALDAIPASTYFFWSGLSKPKSAVGDWQRSLKRLLILAGVPDGHAHRFRDTFSVELLLAGVPIQRVSILLGHQSVRITEKHYSPWVRARQEQLEADVRRTWQTHERQQGVHGGYTENDARVIPFKSRRKNGGGGGSRNIQRIENAQVIDFVRCTKLKKCRNCAQLERIWNAPVEKKAWEFSGAPERSGTAADW